MQLREWIVDAAAKLRDVAGSDHAVETARIEAELLACHALGQPRHYLFAHPEEILAAGQLGNLQSLLQQRLEGEPLAYITGEREFWSLSFNVDSRVLIPRPETEALVEYILSLNLPAQSVIADLGTGSGAIAIALATERPQWFCVGVDRSDAALQVANANRRALLAGKGNCGLARANWLDSLASGALDLVVANPPYIDSDDPHLNRGDVRYEPSTALVSGAQGLADLQCIITSAARVLQRDGWLVVEHGWQQQPNVEALFTAAGYREIFSGVDLAGQPRFVAARRPVE